MFVQVIVDVDGTPVLPELVRGIGWGCDEEALRIARQLRFTPAWHQGKKVPMKVVIPVDFKLPKKTSTWSY